MDRGTRDGTGQDIPGRDQVGVLSLIIQHVLQSTLNWWIILEWQDTEGNFHICVTEEGGEPQGDGHAQVRKIRSQWHS